MVKRLSEVISFLKHLGAGLTTSIALYNVLAHSKLCYIGSFVAPDTKLVTTIRKAQQTLTNGPWNAFPGNMLINLESVGLPMQAYNVRYSSFLELTHLNSRAFRIPYPHSTVHLRLRTQDIVTMTMILNLSRNLPVLTREIASQKRTDGEKHCITNVFVNRNRNESSNIFFSIKKSHHCQHN